MSALYDPRERPADPGDRFVRIEPTNDPAAGALFTETVPGGEVWLLRSILFSLVTDATVAARHVRIEVTDGNDLQSVFPAVATQAASLTNRYHYVAGLGVGYAVGVEVVTPLPLPGLPLLPGGIIRGAAANLQAADDLTAASILLERTMLRGQAAELAYELASQLREAGAFAGLFEQTP